MEKNASFVSKFAAVEPSTETQHLYANAVFWGIATLRLLSLEPRFRPNAINTDGGFGSFPGHDSHLLSTLSAVQTHLLLNLPIDNPSSIVNYVVSLRQPDGSFAGDAWGEVDSRFSYCAIACLSLLKSMHAVQDWQPTINWIVSCQNFDGGFGSVPGAESHAGQIFCCVAALGILDSLHLIDDERLGWWLCERQLPNGGLNGRPEKLEDVCYSFWVSASLVLISKLDWIDRDALVQFILKAQDLQDGGIADRPGDCPDIFHTFFGICGLSICGYPGIEELDVRYCMPKQIIDSMGL